MTIAQMTEEHYEPAQSATDLRTEYLLCRRSVLGHAWDPYVDGQVKSSMGRVFSARCPRCTTQRHYVLGYNGEKISVRYVYPDDYKLSGQVSAEELWTEVFVREDDGRLVVKAKRIRTTNVTVPATPKQSAPQSRRGRRRELASV